MHSEVLDEFLRMQNVASFVRVDVEFSQPVGLLHSGEGKKGDSGSGTVAARQQRGATGRYVTSSPRDALPRADASRSVTERVCLGSDRLTGTVHRIEHEHLYSRTASV